MRLLASVLTLLVASGSPAPAPPRAHTTPAQYAQGSGSAADRMSALRRRITAIVAAQPGAEVAIWFQDFATGDTLGVDAAVPFHAASTMKVPVMIELFRRADAGAIALDKTTVLTNEFRSIVDRSTYQLSPGDDSDSLLYRMIGRPVSWRVLNDHMITMSSNLADNVLIDRLGATQISATAAALGAPGMHVLRGVEDIKAYDRGLNNTTTARALGTLLDAIEHGRAASPTACDSMRAVLLRQTERGEIPAGLPLGIRVAHKTGWITATRHDAAIVYPPGRAPYVLVVLTRKIPEVADAQRLMAAISRAAWETAATSR